MSLRENEAGATNISTFAYGVNSIGQRTEVAQTGSAFGSSRDIAWGYDPLGQVTKADSSISGLDRSYQYDLIGNRLKSSDSLTLPGTDNYVVNALNQYTAVPSVASAPSYDNDGNATAYPVPADPSANSTLAWDAENSLKSITVGSSTTIYLYDSQSRRISKKVGSGTSIVYFYDGWNPIAEYSGTTLEKSYTWGMDLSGSMQDAGGVGGLLAVNDGSANYYPTYDGNGNVSEYLDSTGAVAAHYEYDPFGNTTVATGTKVADFSHRFSTKPLDPETGLYYYGYRYYDPVTGRWPSRDPIEEEGGVNLYGFCYNDPGYWYDYLGNESRERREQQRQDRNRANANGRNANRTNAIANRANRGSAATDEAASRPGNYGSALAAALEMAGCKNSCTATFYRRYNPGGTPMELQFKWSRARPCVSCDDEQGISDDDSVGGPGAPSSSRRVVPAVGVYPAIYEDDTSSFERSSQCFDITVR